MLVIDPDGLFNGDRLRACSDLARLYWPFMYLSSNGFGRFEVNYHKFVGSALVGFKAPLTEEVYMGLVQEYADRHLLFLYESDVTGQTWAQWDTNPKFLPRYKTSADHRSPEPPKQKFEAWVRAYRTNRKRLPKFCGKIPETFPTVEAVAVAVAVAGESISKSSSSIASAGESPPPPVVAAAAIDTSRLATVLHRFTPRESLPPGKKILRSIGGFLVEKGATVEQLEDWLLDRARRGGTEPQKYAFWLRVISDDFSLPDKKPKVKPRCLTCWGGGVICPDFHPDMTPDEHTAAMKPCPDCVKAFTA